MRGGRMVYWFVTGACLGLGLDTWALGIFFVAGMILVLVGVFAQRGREAAAVVLFWPARRLHNTVEGDKR